jgi:predicted ATPase
VLPINKLTLKNFKSYPFQPLEFTNLTVFCGNNSVGKSTAIQALGIVLQSNLSGQAQLNGDLIHVGGIDDIHNHDQVAENELSIKIVAKDGNEYRWGYESSEQREKVYEQKFLPNLHSDSEQEQLENGLGRTITYQYIEAERFGPRDNLKLAEHSLHPYWLGKKGEYTIEVLNNLTTRIRHELSLKDSDCGDPRKHSGISTHSSVPNIEAWMGEISPGYKLSPQKEERANTAYNLIIPENGKVTKPINIGFGYSYALSVVTALILASPGDLIIVENPEAHLHPRGQSYLGRLIALTAQANVQVIIETHSDHLLNGIRVITRTHEYFDPSLFTLYYVSQLRGRSSAEKITITKDGKLSSWPEGFFDQQAQDMFTIMTGKTELPSKEG